MSSLRPEAQIDSNLLAQGEKNPMIDYISQQTRYNGIRFLRECCMKLSASVLTMCSAVTYYHKFYSNVKFEDYDPYLIACTCIYLASKVKNDDLKIRDIINIGYHTIHRKEAPLSLEPYFELRDSLVESELLLMRMLKFDLGVDLPQRHLFLFLNAIKDWVGDQVFEELPIYQMCWTILLDSYQIPAIFEHSPEAVAATVIYLTFQIYGIKVTGSKEIEAPWFTFLHPDCKIGTILNLTSEIIKGYSLEKNVKYIPAENI